ncbi:helix-turn-helix transcriptional regulator [Bacillus ndiopicus]|uniref:helix-turn-helix transcriptional regulator n=1 Tax=Bacillus ndiopicus TaxID=1347368 RepID=UPI0005AB493A|nr:helix-turn-helix domain-containing protein [Bacillus ndiopicus]
METVLKSREILYQLRGGESRNDVAKKLDITPQMLGALERGDRTPSLNLAKKIATYYNTTIEDIF